MKNINKLIIILLTVCSVGWSQSKTASASLQFLGIGVGSKAIGMGGAFVATANDASALYWNPAGAARVQSSQAMFTHSKWIADIDFNWAGATINMGSAGTLGASFMYLDYGDMEVTNYNEQEGTGEMFSAKDMCLGLSYAYSLTDRFSVGATVKYIREGIWNCSASGVAVDLGIMFVSDLNNLRIGAAITNFGTDMQMTGKDLLFQHDNDQQHYGNNDQVMAMYRTDYFPLPMAFKVGVGMEVLSLEDHKIDVDADINYPSDNSSSMNIGMEYKFMNFLSLRGGYKSIFLSNSEEGLCLGVGISQEIGRNLDVVFDYSYQDFGKYLKNSQQFSVGIKF